jgi:hypothetical protein
MRIQMKKIKKNDLRLAIVSTCDSRNEEILEGIERLQKIHSDYEIIKAGNEKKRKKRK